MIVPRGKMLTSVASNAPATGSGTQMVESLDMFSSCTKQPKSKYGVSRNGQREDLSMYEGTNQV